MIETYIILNQNNDGEITLHGVFTIFNIYIHYYEKTKSINLISDL